ncbi:CRISPR-associated endonuclease Cas2 [Thermoflavimicrobium daqui]|uniref:CRISPR-associated endoribonuclease Cas2 n=1 Tax=Thermoflavimicrobium daqui TaxID=2137476 RepID=A0A364K7H9_9BACL|nr:CRISPR-associated endonuclease Cas2 [Thermoflavimicrobium daqui]RAL26160.1 CRISPR-associated endonuclease Cas2 [Thermoflavimicrobium daqui]
MKRVVSYDIIDDKRRSRVFKLLKDYGKWVQYSVFELDCKEQEWVAIEFQLTKLLKQDDSLCIYEICKSCSQRTLYKGNVLLQLETEKCNIF